jgi:hypothetical protein
MRFGSGLWIYRRGMLSGRGGAYHVIMELLLLNIAFCTRSTRSLEILLSVHQCA